MIICGVELSGQEAILALIDFTDNDYNLIIPTTKKIPLGNSEDRDQVKSFQKTFESFCIENDVGRVCIKKRNTTGRFSGGPTAAKLEGLIQISDVSEVKLISPNTYRAMQKREDIVIPKEVMKYQWDAYLTALAGR